MILWWQIGHCDDIIVYWYSRQCNDTILLWYKVTVFTQWGTVMQNYETVMAQ